MSTDELQLLLALKDVSRGRAVSGVNGKGPHASPRKEASQKLGKKGE